MHVHPFNHEFFLCSFEIISLLVLACPVDGVSATPVHMYWGQRYSRAQVLGTALLRAQVLGTALLPCLGVGDSAPPVPRCWGQRYSRAQVFGTALLPCPGVGDRATPKHTFSSSLIVKVRRIVKCVV